MEKYDELIRTAQLLKTVPVNGDYWAIMQACFNSVVNVANAIAKENGMVQENGKEEKC